MVSDPNRLGLFHMMYFTAISYRKEFLLIAYCLTKEDFGYQDFDSHDLSLGCKIYPVEPEYLRTRHRRMHSTPLNLPEWPRMNNTAIVAALPIGEFDSGPVTSEFEVIIGVFNRLEAEVVVSDSVSTEEQARQSVKSLAERNPDLLLITTLHGLTAPVIETAARTSPAPILIWPVQGKFALPSSTLALGALQETGIPVELYYAPPNHLASIGRIQCFIKAAKAYSRITKSRIGTALNTLIEKANQLNINADLNTIKMR